MFKNKSSIIKLIVFITIILIVIFLMSLIFNNINKELVIFGAFLLFIIVTLSTKTTKVTIPKPISKVIDRGTISSKSNIKAPIKKKEENIKTIVKKTEPIKEIKEVKKVEPKKEIKKEEKKEEKKEKKEPVKVLIVPKKEEKKEIEKLVIKKEEPKKELNLKINKKEEKKESSNIKNLKVSNEEKIKDTKLKLKEEKVVKKPIKNIVVNKDLPKKLVKESKPKLTEKESVFCAYLTKNILSKNKKIKSVSYSKDKEGYVSVPDTNIKFKVNNSNKYMIVPKSSSKGLKTKESGPNNVQVYVNDDLTPLHEFIEKEAKKITNKKKSSKLHLFTFNKKLSDKIIKRKKEKEKKKELITIMKLYLSIANMYHRAGDYNKEYRILKSAIERLKDKGIDLSPLERKAMYANKLIKEKELEKIRKQKKKIKEREELL